MMSIPKQVSIKVDPNVRIGGHPIIRLEIMRGLDTVFTEYWFELDIGSAREVALALARAVVYSSEGEEGEWNMVEDSDGQ